MTFISADTKKVTQKQLHQYKTFDQGNTQNFMNFVKLYKPQNLTKNNIKNSKNHLKIVTNRKTMTVKIDS